MSDILDFKLTDPVENKEKWALDDAEIGLEFVGVEIWLNNREITEILKEIEEPFANAENHPNLAGSYGHNSPENLYNELTNATLKGTSAYQYGAELLVCGDCGISGCWSVCVYVSQDDNFVYWYKFQHNHRQNWQYPISYRFDKESYLVQMQKLKSFIHQE